MCYPRHEHVDIYALVTDEPQRRTKIYVYLVCVSPVPASLSPTGHGRHTGRVRARSERFARRRTALCNVAAGATFAVF